MRIRSPKPPFCIFVHLSFFLRIPSHFLQIATMRRGSVSSWQSYGQRNSDINMMQTYEGNTALPPPCEEIVHQRKGGWFLTYKKILSFIVLFVIVVIVAGLIGWNLGTMPKTRIYDPSALIEEEVEEGSDVITASISPFVHPSRYNLELMLLNDVNTTSKLKGRVVIEFRVDDTTPLSQLSLNARNITATRYKLSLIEENGARAKRRRRRRAENNDTGGQENAENATTLSPTVMSSSQLENQETTRMVVTDYPIGNATASGNETSPLTNESSSVPDEKTAGTANATTSGQAVSTTITSGNGSATDVEIERYEEDANNGLHVIYPAVAMNPGMYSLEIDYEIPLDGKTIYLANFNESGGKSLIGTQLKPVGASHLLPVFDDVNLKAVFSVSMARPREARVLSNMPLNISKDTSEDDRVIDTFSDTPLLSPYNLAFVMGEIESLSETKVGPDNATRVTFWGDPKRRSRGSYLLDKPDGIVVRFNDMFSMPYPLPKLDIVALPSRIVDNAGSPGLISLKQSFFYAADRSPMVTKTDALSALISLIGEQWLGGVVNMKNWTDVWLLEGSTLHLRHAMIEKIDSSLDSNHAFLANTQWDAMEEDSYSVSKPLQSNVNPAHLDFSDARNKKGACLIRMLHGVINDTAFRNGYRKFIARWNYSTANVDDFWEAMAEETVGLPVEITLSEAMNSWTSHRGYPIVSVMRKYKEGTAVVRQQRFTYDQSPSDTEPTWYVPLDYINKTSTDWSSSTKTWLHSETEMVVRNVGAEDSWIVFNVNKTGYYRVHYDEENWKLLTQALEENHEAFPAETRASLIDDVLGLASVGLTKYATAFDFIKYMQMKERHYAPWGALMRHLLKLNGLLYETSGFSAFQEFTLRFTSKLYSDVGWKIDEGSRLTLTALTIACAFENAECLEWARSHFTKLKDHSDADEVVPAYAREVLYCTIARYGTRNEWNYFVERANSTADRDEKNRILSAFACFQTPWILQSILSELLEGKLYDEDETQRILRSFPQNPVAAQIAYKFVQNNWQVIVTRFSKSRPILKAFALAMTNGLISEEDFEDFQTFSEDNLESIKIVGYTMAMVEAHAKFAIKWLKESLPEVQEWIAANNSTEVSI